LVSQLNGDEMIPQIMKITRSNKVTNLFSKKNFMILFSISKRLNREILKLKVKSNKLKNNRLLLILRKLYGFVTK